jgi:hypothetical protein
LSRWRNGAVVRSAKTAAVVDARSSRRGDAGSRREGGVLSRAGSKRILLHEAYHVFWLSLNIKRAAAMRATDIPT